MDKEPSLPVSLRLKFGSLYSQQRQERVGPALVTYLNRHLSKCPLACKCPVLACKDQYCTYFNWFITHHQNCQQASVCPSCAKLMEWMTLHTATCDEQSQCPLEQLCTSMKKQQLKDSLKMWNQDVFIKHSHSPYSDSTNRVMDMSEVNLGNPCSNPNGSQLVNGNEIHSAQNENSFHLGEQNVAMPACYPDSNLTIAASLPYTNGHAPRLLPSDASDVHMHSHSNVSHDHQGRSCDPLILPHPSSIISPARGAAHTLAELPPTTAEPFELNGVKYTRFSRNCSFSNSWSLRDFQTALKTREISPAYQNCINTDAMEQRKGDIIQATRTRESCNKMMSPLTEDPSNMESCEDGAITRLEDMKDCFGSTADDYLTSVEGTESALDHYTISEMSRRISSLSSPNDNDKSDSERNSSSIKHRSGSKSSFCLLSNRGTSNCSPPSRRMGSLHRRVRTTTSNNILKRMEKIDDISISPVPAASESPAPHAPIQRNFSETLKVLVSGVKGTSVTILQDPSRDQNDEGGGEEESMDGAKLAEACGAESDECVDNEQLSDDAQSPEALKYPAQRIGSIGNGMHDTLVLGPGLESISIAQFNSLFKHGRLQNLLENQKNDGNNPVSQALATVTPSSPPSSSSSHFSSSSSQPSSLGESISGGEKEHEVEGKPKLNGPLRVDLEASLNPQILELIQSQAEHPSSRTSWNGPANSTSSPGTIKNTTNSSCSRPSNFYEMSSKFGDNFSLPEAEFRHGDNAISNGVTNPYGGSTYNDSHKDQYCAQEDRGLDPHIFAQCSLTDSDVGGCSHINFTGQRGESDNDFSRDAPPPRDRISTAADPIVPITKKDMEGMYAWIDEVRELNRGDLEELRSRGKIMRQQNPMASPGEEMIKIKDQHLLLWNTDGDVLDGDLPSQFPNDEMKLYIKSLAPVDPGRVAEEEVNHREYLRQYLMGQFRRKRVYREGVHWTRGPQLGRGGQATCYSIIDRSTKLTLALKEESENDKSLDEAYVCLKLAYELNVSRNIVEYFSAAMLPSCNRNIIQLFMEIMPTCMQSYIHTVGPLSMTDVHHFSFQLFDALEFLHNRGKIIHCDIKPANLLLDITAQHMKLADFGAAELLDERRMLSDRVHSDSCGGTLHYNPPEYYSRGGECSFALDSWQAGCCILAMSTGRRPWRHLYMDPVLRLEERSMTCRVRSFNSLKKCYSAKIGMQVDGHMFPAFLDEDIKRLLYGCLHSDSSMRLTAVECRQLLAFSEEMSEEQRKKVSDAIGYPRITPQILQSYPPNHTQIDIFLGSFCEKTVIRGHDHTLYPGWLGSLPYRQGMTYDDLHHMISPVFPVLKHVPRLEISLCEQSPQEFFVAMTSHSSPSHQQHLHPLINLGQLVDPSKSVVLFQPQTQRTVV